MKWIFNPLLIWGAILGFIIFSGIGQIRDAWYHEGPGFVTYEEPERTERVSESQYKRHEFTMGGFMLAIGIFLWVILAKAYRPKNEKAEDDSTDPL